MWSGEKQPQFLLAFDKQACNMGTARLEKSLRSNFDCLYLIRVSDSSE